MGIRRKKITDRRREKIEELLTCRSPQEVHDVLKLTRDCVSLSTIYKIRRKSQQNSAVGGVVVEKIKGAEHEQALTEETSHAHQSNEKEKLVALIQKWRAELESYTPVQLARLWLGKALREAAEDSLSNKESKRLFHEAKRSHFQNQTTTGIPPGVESDPGFRSLRQRFPTSGAWAQLDMWRKQVASYLPAYWDWLSDLETIAQSLLDSENSSASGTLLYFGTRRVVCLWALAMACHLLAKGLGELPGDVRHGILIAELSKLQAETDLEILLLTNRTSKGGPAKDTERIWTDSEDVAGLVQRTRELISEWLRLQSTQDSLLIAIQKMEDSV